MNEIILKIPPSSGVKVNLLGCTELSEREWIEENDSIVWKETVETEKNDFKKKTMIPQKKRTQWSKTYYYCKQSTMEIIRFYNLFVKKNNWEKI